MYPEVHKHFESLSYAEQISIPLRRKIYNGNRYSKFLPKSTCQTSNLGNGENTIAEGVDFMAQHVKEWAHQTEKITKALGLQKILQEKGIPATVAVVYWFLYSHIQYSADWQTQNLRSPACSWYARKQGIDCKSYSIFAACILENLGLNYSIRRVKQPGSHPDLWSHVYVTVMLDQTSNPQQQLDEKNYLVIDATKHENSEVAYLEKQDTIMSQKHKYVAMNAAETSGILTEEEYFLANSFADIMRAKGFSSSKIDEMFSYLTELLKSGVSKTEIYFSLNNNGLKISPSINSEGKYFNKNLGLGNAEEAYTEAFSDVFDDVVNEDTFANIWNKIKDVLNFSCWGAHMKPDQAESHLKKDLSFAGLPTAAGLNKSTAGINELNKFIGYCTMYAHVAKMKESDMSSSCSKKSYAAMHDAVLEYRDNVIKAYENEVKRLGGSLLLDNNIVPNLGSNKHYKTATGCLNLPVISGGWGGFDSGNAICYSKIPFPYKKIIGISKLPPVTFPDGNSSVNNATGGILDGAIKIGDSVFNSKKLGSNSNSQNKVTVPNTNTKTSTGTKVMTAGAGAAILLLVGPKLLEAFKNTKKSSK